MVLNPTFGVNRGLLYRCGVSSTGIAVANIIARRYRLSPPETVAISIECCHQNGTPMSYITMFSNKEERKQAVSVPPLGIIEAVVIGIYCVGVEGGLDQGPCGREHLCRHFQTYEVDDDEEDEDDEVGFERRREVVKDFTDQFDASDTELDPEALVWRRSRRWSQGCDRC
jgi:hypothetical protein